MSWKIVSFVFFIIILAVFFPIFLLLYYQYRSLAAPIKADIVVDIKKVVGKVPDRWRALAQGGEEKGVRMLENVTSQVAQIYPRFIRIDHIYDFYDVVSRDAADNLSFNFSKLDETVCDIYKTGAKPFFVLGYMPPALSLDGSLVSLPKDWNEWALLVQQTIEHYSGTGTRLCGQITDFWLNDIYYEVWNEPDLETFGKWTIKNSNKDYKSLYFYSSLGALKAKNVNRFYLGGPATSNLYQNWILSFLDFVKNSNVKFDFLSWHHYTANAQDFATQIGNIKYWLTSEEYEKFRDLPLIISEWGYDSEPNPIADTNIGAAHTLASIINFLSQKVEAAFLFEIKDGPTPRWGILSYDGLEKPRYKALQLLNLLEGSELFVEGEGSFVQAIASESSGKTTVIIVNYDQKDLNTEAVPLTIVNLLAGSYTMKTTYLDEKVNSKSISVKNVPVTGGKLHKTVIMPPNSIIAIELFWNQ